MVVFSRNRSYRTTSENEKLIVCIGWFQTRAPLCYTFWYIVTKSFAHAVRIEPNVSQAFLSHDDVVDDLAVFGWVNFIQSFKGFNLEIAQAFTQTFNGTRAKIGDLQLQVSEESIVEATSL
jgi:hypothetical protein